MLLLVLGILLWCAGHLWKRLAPDARAGLGDKGKAVAAAVIGVGLVLMILGYRGAAFVPVWTPPALMTHINNLLMLVAVFLFFVGGAKGKIAQRFRHPQLTGFSLWAFAHLLVNGDLPSFVLFGGLLLWALVEMAVINRAEPNWVRPPHQTVMRKEVMAAVGAVAAYLVVGLIHAWLGYNPFGA